MHLLLSLVLIAAVRVQTGQRSAVVAPRRPVDRDRNRPQPAVEDRDDVDWELGGQFCA